MQPSLPLALLILFLDGATIGLASTPLLLEAGKSQPPWILATAGGLASALGAVLQLLGLRLLLDSKRRWVKRWLPLRRKLEDALQRYRRASFLGLVLMRATPMPDLPIKLVAAAGGYPVLLYGLAVWLGAMPYYYVLAKLGEKFRPPWWAIGAAMAALAAVALLERYRRRERRRAS